MFPKSVEQKIYPALVQVPNSITCKNGILHLTTYLTTHSFSFKHNTNN